MRKLGTSVGMLNAWCSSSPCGKQVRILGPVKAHLLEFLGMMNVSTPSKRSGGGSGGLENKGKFVCVIFFKRPYRFSTVETPHSLQDECVHTQRQHQVLSDDLNQNYMRSMISIFKPARVFVGSYVARLYIDVLLVVCICCY